jgi:hypothetical protein
LLSTLIAGFPDRRCAGPFPIRRIDDNLHLGL